MKLIILLICMLCLNSCVFKEVNYGFKKQDLKRKDFRELIIKTDSLKQINILKNSWENLSFKVSKLIDSCLIIPLETNGENLIGRIDELKIYEDKIYILDKRMAKSVFVFDLKGKYIGEIGKKGKGPGEYPKPDGFEIDIVNRELLVISVGKRKILRYDFKGNFLGYHKIKIANHDIKVLDNGNMVFLGGDQRNNHLGELKNKIIYITNNKGDLLSYGPTAPSDYVNVKEVRGGNMMVQNNEISYSYKYSDTIFQVRGNELIAQYKLNFINCALNRRKYKDKSFGDFVNSLKNEPTSPALFNGSHFQTTDYLIFNFTVKEFVYTGFYNKNQSKLIMGQPIYDETKIYFAPLILSSYNDYFVSYESAYRIKQILKANSESSIEKQSLITALKKNNSLDINEEDNPVLFFYKFKKEYHETKKEVFN
ncbi:MAG: hypothetical protein COC06_09885 [Bacteroidales bacterium]|nr:MAG: hypothetical protein COC06_09885 [Bacteroidales bacterium]